MSVGSSLASIVRFRWLLYELVKYDIIQRYRGSLFGFAWTLMNPIIFVAIYTLVFSIYIKTGVHAFPLYLLSGMIPWIWMSQAISQAVSAILDGRNYVGKTLMPTEILILVPVFSNGFNFLITIALVFPVSAALGVPIWWALLFLPLLAVIELVMTAGFSFLVATVNVFYRDMQQVVAYALLALFFLTPIFYVRFIVPPNLAFLVKYSPIAALISSYQNVFYYGIPPSWRDLLFAGAFSVVLLILALMYFNRHRDAFGEYV
ncbi:MAG: ABC transporter permease [Candidatus Tumulicola sp.]